MFRVAVHQAFRVELHREQEGQGGAVVRLQFDHLRDPVGCAAGDAQRPGHAVHGLVVSAVDAQLHAASELSQQRIWDEGDFMNKVALGVHAPVVIEGITPLSTTRRP